VRCPSQSRLHQCLKFNKGNGGWGHFAPHPL
jgi:hypothetical protein